MPSEFWRNSIPDGWSPQMWASLVTVGLCWLLALKAHHERTGLAFEPGDNRAIVAAIGEEHVHKDLPVEDPHDHGPGAADLMKDALEEEEKLLQQELRQPNVHTPQQAAKPAVQPGAEARPATSTANSARADSAVS